MGIELGGNEPMTSQCIALPQWSKRPAVFLQPGPRIIDLPHNRSTAHGRALRIVHRPSSVPNRCPTKQACNFGRKRDNRCEANRCEAEPPKKNPGPRDGNRGSTSLNIARATREPSLPPWNDGSSSPAESTAGIQEPCGRPLVSCSRGSSQHWPARFRYQGFLSPTTSMLTRRSGCRQARSSSRLTRFSA